MIKVNELRIGNKLLLNNDVICTINEIRYNFLRVTYLRKDVNREHTSLVEIYRFEPIPLTEEKLVKCGFEFKERVSGKIKEYRTDILSIFYNDNGIVSVNIGIQRIDDGKRIKHLHQLQNICFALSGEELNIEL